MTPDQERELVERQLDADRVYLYNCTSLTTVPDFPNAEYVVLNGCTGLTEVPNFARATTVYLTDCVGLTTVPNFTIAVVVALYGCAGLTEVPNFALARLVGLKGCTGLTDHPVIYADHRGYELRPYYGGYVAGCRRFRSPEEAIAHWGGPDYENPERGAKYVAAIEAHKRSTK